MTKNKNPYRTLDTKPISAPAGKPANEPRVKKTVLPDIKRKAGR